MCGYPLNHLVDFHEILCGVNTIKGDLDAIIVIAIVSTVLKWLMFNFQMELKYIKL
jgi:hypothetical protein